MKNMSRFSRLLKNDGAAAGFTLLEVMVALAIIAIVLVSVLRMQGQTISMHEAFRFYTIAPELAMSKMADIRLDPDAAELAASGDFGEEFSGYKWKVATEELNLLTDEDREMTLQRVDVTVTYMEDAYAYTVREYIPAEDSAF